MIWNGGKSADIFQMADDNNDLFTWISIIYKIKNLILRKNTNSNFKIKKEI